MLTGSDISVDDVIVAEATSRASGVRGVIRLSGDRALAVVAAFSKARHELDQLAVASSTRAVVIPTHLVLPAPLGRVPATLLVWPGRRSYTRQPTVEIHTVGCTPILDAITSTACAAGARAARRGEFTLRALLAGRLDLTQAEAVLGVIEARSPQQLSTALSQLAGGLASPLAALREELLDLLSLVEAGLDFADEDLDLLSSDELTSRIEAVAAQVIALEDQLASRAVRTSRPRVLLAGRPNAGKSSLFNALAGYHAAIVADVAGTTRDYLTQTIRLGLLEIDLLDTAGLDETVPTTKLDALAQQVTISAAAEADLVLWCIDARRLGDPREAIPEVWKTLAPAVVIGTKCDLLSPAEMAQGRSQVDLLVSSAANEGLAQLRERIAQEVALDALSPAVASTAARSQHSLATARASLAEAAQIARSAIGADELVAAELRIAIDALGDIAGVTYTDDILDRVFSKFCIGK